jgi:hypothetical protein
VEYTLDKEFLWIGLRIIKFDDVDFFRFLVFIEAHYPLGFFLIYPAQELILAI